MTITTVSFDKNEAHDFEGLGFDIHFQKGPVKEGGGVNGCQNEDLLRILIQRTKILDENFPCRENKYAIQKMEESLLWFNERTRIRVEQNVEGENKEHLS